MYKNTAGQKLRVYVFDAATNLPKTGDAANLTAYVSKDYGAVTVLADTSATEEDATNAKGFYLFDLAQSETNADVLGFSCKSSTANMVCLPVPSVTYTRPPNFSTTAITAAGKVTVGTNDDKTAYELADGAITAAKVAASALDGKGNWNVGKTGYSLADGSIVSATFGVGTTLPRVTLVDTTTTNTDMRGTDGAALASAWTPTRAGYVDNLSGGAVMLAANYTAPLSAAGTRAAVGLAAANLDTQLADLPTVAEFDARSIASGSYSTLTVSQVDGAIASAGLATAANLATVAGYLDTEIAAILEDTGTTIPAQIAALNNLSSAQAQTAAAAALTAYDPPTNAEMEARTLAAASYATASSISALNNLSAAQVNAEVDQALADYDGPTNAEMEARTIVSASYATSANQTTIISHLTDVKGATFDGSTDSLESIRNRGDSAWATATAVTVSDKTGFKLASDGLDSVATTAPSGVASNFREMLVQVWRRFFKKTVKSATEIKTYADNGSSVLTTQTISESGDDQTLGAAS